MLAFSIFFEYILYKLIFTMKKTSFYFQNSSYTVHIEMTRGRRRANIGRRTTETNRRLSQRRSENEEQRSNANELQRNSRLRNRSTNAINLASRRRTRRAEENMSLAAFRYDNEADYSMYASIGEMTVRCQHCDAAKFPGETPGMCCASGKVKLPAFASPPDPLRSLIMETSSTSRHFLSHIQEYNAAFQMTSFGASNIVRDSFMPTFKVITSCGLSYGIGDMNSKFFDVFKNSDPISSYISRTLQIQGQIYHRAGSLLPFADGDYSFLQIYFIGDANRELDRRCTIGGSHTKREIVSQLQTFLHHNNEWVRMFKTALERMPSDNHKIIIKADRTPFGEHARRFNAPTIDEVAIVIVGEQTLPRDIVLHRRNEQLQRVSELHIAISIVTLER